MESGRNSLVNFLTNDVSHRPIVANKNNASRWPAGCSTTNRRGPSPYHLSVMSDNFSSAFDIRVSAIHKVPLLPGPRVSHFGVGITTPALPQVFSGAAVTKAGLVHNRVSPSLCGSLKGPWPSQRRDSKTSTFSVMYSQHSILQIGVPLPAGVGRPLVFLRFQSVDHTRQGSRQWSSCGDNSKQDEENNGGWIHLDEVEAVCGGACRTMNDGDCFSQTRTEIGIIYQYQGAFFLKVPDIARLRLKKFSTDDANVSVMIDRLPQCCFS